MKFMQSMKQRRKDNKGFTLVELIIVMAIMAILLGIVGTQVIPYLNRAREAKDLQILNSFSTAAVSAYSFHSEDFKDTNADGIEIGDALAAVSGLTGLEKDLVTDIQELTGYSSLTELKDDLVSKKGQDVTGVSIDIDLTTGEVVAEFGGDTGLDKVTSVIGGDVSTTP